VAVGLDMPVSVGGLADRRVPKLLLHPPEVRAVRWTALYVTGSMILHVPIRLSVLGLCRKWNLHSSESLRRAHGRASANKAPTCVQAVRKPSTAAKSCWLTSVCCGSSSGLSLCA